MNRPAFEKLVQHSLRRLPQRFKKRLENISIEIEDNPSAALLKDMKIQCGTLFGLYQGVPLTEREWNYGNVLPDRIIIYQRPIEGAATSSAEIEEIVMDTVKHEIGHYFGFDDDALYIMEHEKSKKSRKKKVKR
jgi:predicted Zn-dependent protease with MMP-like domain